MGEPSCSLDNRQRQAYKVVMFTHEAIMTTHHTPATPLPWNSGLPTSNQTVDGQRGVWAGKIGVADVYGYAANSTYIAHAANAYPKLVALAKLLDEWERNDMTDRVRDEMVAYAAAISKSFLLQADKLCELLAAAPVKEIA